MPRPDILKPSPALLCKLGSIIVHAEEGASAQGHPFDVIALRQLLADPEVKQWLDDMAAAALLPVKWS
jgi:hypothetical protein